MICYFPTAYPDELLYSQLSCYYAKSGHLAYAYAAEELYQRKVVRPDMDFINPLTADALRVITQEKPIADVILKHTMFPYYGHFLPLEKRKLAFESLVTMKGNHYNLMPIPKNKTGSARYLKYCPLCAEHDRNAYGETYWHRTHQMIGMSACPIHGCYLMNSSVIISGKAPPMLKSAEEVIPETSIAVSATEIEFQLAQYMAAVFHSTVDMDCEVTIGQFLHSQMANTKYRSIRGQQRNMELLHSDFSLYYKDLPNNWFTELWQIQKVLTDDRTNFYEVCLIAMFLGIPPVELVHRVLPNKTQQELFDAEVHRLHAQGLKYPDIAKQLGASYPMVKSIGCNLYGSYHKPVKPTQKPSIPQHDWEKVDNDTLPLVKEAIQTLIGDSTTRPQRITVYKIERMFGLSSKKISLHLPRCRAEIEQYLETQEQFWAREIVWAAEQILKSGSTLTLRKIEHLINIRRNDIERCVPYLCKYGDAELVEQVVKLL